MSQLFDTLASQHKNIFRLLSLIEAQIDCVEADEMPNVNLMLDIMQYLTRYVDAAHHPVEEALMDLYENQVSEADACVALCHSQHDKILELGRSFGAVIEGVREEQLVERQQFIKAGRDYVEYQLEHMNLEEGQVFPLLRATLQNPQIEAVGESITASRDPLFGKIVEKEYQKLYDYILRSV
jgi:hemerythrin-like domain-containing protein